MCPDICIDQNPDNCKIAVQTTHGIQMLSPDQIICIKTRKRGTEFITSTGTYFSLKGITYWAEILDFPCFFQTYRSFIVNMDYVRLIRKDSVVLDNFSKDIEAYLSRRKYADFKRCYFEYIDSRDSLLK